MVISNSTISRNQAGGYGQMFCSYNPGGNVYTSGRLILRNTIVAYGMGTNCEGPITSDGYNLSDDSSCNFHNIGDRNNIDPKLGTLGNYGGPTQTIRLLSGSPAIDAGNPSGCTDGQGHLLKTDQRGMPRPNTEDIEDKKGCDMRAYERQSD